MQEILSTFSTLLWISSIIFFFIMFYLSIKKCFWKDDINKVKLFFLTLLTNPFALFAVSFIATMSITLIIMIYVIISANPIDQKEVVNEVISQVKSTFVLSLSVEISCFFCLIFIILLHILLANGLKHQINHL